MPSYSILGAGVRLTPASAPVRQEKIPLISWRGLIALLFLLLIGLAGALLFAWAWGAA